MIKLPNLLIIGAPRSGTETILNILGQHPEIFVAERELHFFDRNYDRGIKWYESHFTGMKGEKVGCEKTANYLVSLDCAEKIKTALPNVKLLISLRNPIYRLLSHYRNWIRNGTISHKISITEFAQKHPDILDMGRYNIFVEKYLDYFSSNNIKIILFENFINDLSFLTNEIETFLDIKPFGDVQSVKLNSSNKLYIFKNKILSKRLAKLASKFPSYITKRLDYNINLSDEDYSFLKDTYKDNNIALSKYLDVGVWNV